ncbi:MAG: hypothetical protein N6V49_01520 [Serratia symbiotica]|nr:hypothetical protein [Serratia symbiotica]
MSSLNGGYYSANADASGVSFSANSRLCMPLPSIKRCGHIQN